MTLATKIAAASKDVGGKLSADKRNQDQGYDYLSADKILTFCGQALAGQGVALFPAIMEMNAETVTYLKTWKGGSEEKTRYDARVQFLMKLSDGEDAQDLIWYGLGSDYAVPDKAVYKAITSGHKYFLMKLLNVGAGNEDGEHETGEEVKVVKQAPAQPQRPQPKPATGPAWTPDPNGFDDLPSASATAAGGNGKTAPATPQAAHDPAAPWDDNRKAEAVRWAMRRYPEVFKAPQHAMNSLNNCIDAITENGTVDAPPDVIARAWKDKCAAKQDELDAAKDAAAGITHADLDKQAAAQS